MQVWTHYFGTTEKLLLATLGVLTTVFVWQVGQNVNAQPTTGLGSETIVGFYSPTSVATSYRYQDHLTKAKVVSEKNNPALQETSASSLAASSVTDTQSDRPRSNINKKRKSSQEITNCGSVSALQCLRALSNI